MGEGCLPISGEQLFLGREGEMGLGKGDANVFVKFSFLKQRDPEQNGQNIHQSPWSEGYVGIYHHILCSKYLTIVIKNKTVLSKVLAIEKISKSSSRIIQVMEIQIKTQSARRSPREILKREGACCASGRAHVSPRDGSQGQSAVSCPMRRDTLLRLASIQAPACWSSMEQNEVPAPRPARSLGTR